MQQVWLLNRNGDVMQVATLKSLWPQLPSKIDSVDAVYQRILDNVVVVFKGQYNYCTNDNSLSLKFVNHFIRLR